MEISAAVEDSVACVVNTELWVWHLWVPLCFFAMM